MKMIVKFIWIFMQLPKFYCIPNGRIFIPMNSLGYFFSKNCMLFVSGGAHSPSPRSENFKPKEFRPAGILADSNNNRSQPQGFKSTSHHVAMGAPSHPSVGVGGPYQRFSPPANLQASSFSNAHAGHKDGTT